MTRPFPVRAAEPAPATPLSQYVPTARPKSPFARVFDHVAMSTYPWLARLAGYRARVGKDEALARDGHAILREVWGAKGLLPPEDAASWAARYDEGTTWIVMYHRGKPAGVMGLLDLRVASVACDFSRRRLPELDLATTREICRLAILPEHRGGAQLVMVGLLREMLHWSKENGIALLFSGSTEQLFRVYRRFNPTAKLLELPPDPREIPERERYYEKLRAYGAKNDVIYTFEVAGASPWDVFSRFLTGRLRSSK